MREHQNQLNESMVQADISKGSNVSETGRTIKSGYFTQATGKNLHEYTEKYTAAKYVHFMIVYIRNMSYKDHLTFWQKLIAGYVHFITKPATMHISITI